MAKKNKVDKWQDTSKAKKEVDKLTTKISNDFGFQTTGKTRVGTLSNSKPFQLK